MVSGTDFFWFFVGSSSCYFSAEHARTPHMHTLELQVHDWNANFMWYHIAYLSSLLCGEGLSRNLSPSNKCRLLARGIQMNGLLILRSWARYLHFSCKKGNRNYILIMELLLNRRAQRPLVILLKISLCTEKNFQTIFVTIFHRSYKNCYTTSSFYENRGKRI